VTYAHPRTYNLTVVCAERYQQHNCADRYEGQELHLGTANIFCLRIHVHMLHALFYKASRRGCLRASKSSSISVKSSIGTFLWITESSSSSSHISPSTIWTSVICGLFLRRLNQLTIPKIMTINPKRAIATRPILGPDANSGVCVERAALSSGCSTTVEEGSII